MEESRSNMLEIRRYRQTDDIDEISSIYALSWKTAYRGIIPDDFLDAISETRWSPLLKAESNRLLLAIEDGKPVGVSTYCEARDEALKGWGEIISLYLIPSHYRKGIGSKLFSEVVDVLAEEGYSDIYLWVLEDNSAARAFYEKNGFMCSGDINPDNIGGRAVNELRYIRTATVPIKNITI
ncbi:MAG: N-acetyltransferase [Firmicutes bacterium HGW-Firmicutes-16]|nr:MAG: N-acetyltransferase [Firmicutes bacterium HGW-Firmicutes-16]